MPVLYLTNNVQLASTARILTSWLTLGPEHGVSACVAVRQEGQLADWLRDHGVPYTTSPMRWPSRTWPVPAVLDTWRLASWARSRKVSLVHCNEHDVYPFGRLVARVLKVPIVCHVRFRIDRGFGAWAFGGGRQPDALLWTSNQQRQDSADAVDDVVPEARQHLVPLGPDPAVFRPSPDDRQALRRSLDVGDAEIAIGTATALRPVKRIGDFIDLVRDLAARHPNVVGLIAGAAVPGEEAYRDEVVRRIADASLGRRLRWLGHLEPIAPFLQALDVFVSTSEYETFGNSVCEAMACGVPVAGYTGGSVREIIGDAGVVVPNGDVRALTAAVADLVRDGAARSTLAEQGRRRVAVEFDPAVSYQKLMAIYSAVQR